MSPTQKPQMEYLNPRWYLNNIQWPFASNASSKEPQLKMSSADDPIDWTTEHTYEDWKK